MDEQRTPNRQIQHYLNLQTIIKSLSLKFTIKYR